MPRAVPKLPPACASAGGGSRLVLVGLALAVLACLGAGCRSSPAGWAPGPAGPYETLPAEEERRLEEALAAAEAGRPEAARVTLERLTLEHPRNVLVAVLLQELELATGVVSASTLEAAGLAPEPGAGDGEEGLPAAAGGGDAAELLRRAWRARAEADATVRNLVLAARVESDPPAARILLDRAVAVAPDCAWAHYGRAHVAARQGDWQESRAALAEALRLAPGHMPARRLEAWLLARRGRPAEAIAALAWWLPRAEGDPSVTRASWLAAKLDLATLLVQQGRPREALAHLDELEAAGFSEERRLTVRAAAQQALERPEQALAAARAAAAGAPESSLALVQQALLLERWLDDPVAARAAWQEVLASSAGEQDLGTLLQRTRARMHLERAAAGAPAGTGPAADEAADAPGAASDGGESDPGAGRGAAGAVREP